MVSLALRVEVGRVCHVLMMVPQAQSQAAGERRDSSLG